MQRIPRFFEALFARWRRSAIAVPTTVLAVAALLVVSEQGYHRTRQQLQDLTRMGQVRIAVLELQRAITDAETGQRGYLLTQRNTYLKPYQDGLADIAAIQQRLQGLLAESGDPQGQQQVLALKARVAEKLAEMDTVLKLQAGGNPEGAIAVTQLDRGNDLMGDIRRECEGLIERQNSRIRASLTGVYDTLRIHRIGIAAMASLMLLLMLSYLRLSQVQDRDRAARQAELVRERDTLEAQVRARTEELTELNRHLEHTREDERARLARELHDELGALLTAAKLDVARLRPRLQAELPELLPRVQHLVDTLNSGIALKRRIIEDLRPSSLSNLGLKAALDVLCSESATRLGIPVEADTEELKLSESAELTLYRLVQESLTNVAKYAQAKTVFVQVRTQAGRVLAVVEDDGQGFDVQQVSQQRHGLLGMRYRVEAEGGELQVSSVPGEGTTIRAWLPMGAS